MDADTAEMYWKSIDTIEARDMIMQMKLMDFPHMKDGKRKELHKTMFKIAYPKHEEDRITEKPRSTEEFATLLKGALHG